MKEIKNVPSVSLQNKSIPKGGDTQTQFASAKVLAKANGGGDNRAPEFKLENKKANG